MHCCFRTHSMLKKPGNYLHYRHNKMNRFAYGFAENVHGHAGDTDHFSFALIGFFDVVLLMTFTETPVALGSARHGASVPSRRGLWSLRRASNFSISWRTSCFTVS